MRVLPALLAAPLLTGCVTSVSTLPQLRPDPEIIYVLVKTKPEDAEITFADGSMCETPCRVGVIREVEMTVGRTGYRPVSRTITRMTPSPLVLTLEPVVVEQEIERVDLPDL